MSRTRDLPQHDYQLGFRCKTPAKRCLCNLSSLERMREAACRFCLRCFFCADEDGCRERRAVSLEKAFA